MIAESINKSMDSDGCCLEIKVIAKTTGHVEN